MATTTPNFGWPVPTSTDLVKDGATAIEALGDAIDASMADLEGGTSGQILAKNSNTDMDFIWITNDVGDITSVVAGTALTGGGTSGAVTLNFDYAVGNQAIESEQTASYTLILSDAGKMVTMTNASANNLTVPPNSSVAFPVNTRIDLIQYGAGQTTIVAGSGVTILSSGSKLKLTGQYSGASLWKKATDTWVLVGDIAS
jgi:hypothetical protein